MSASDQGNLFSHRDGFPARYPSPFDVGVYIWRHRPRFDILPVAALSYHGVAFLVPYGSASRDPAAGGMAQPVETIGWTWRAGAICSLG